jgi:hypothetical protein
MTTACETPPDRQWEFVQQLLRDLQNEEEQEEIARAFGGWSLALKSFRRAETRRMVLQEPTEVDRLFHRACVTNLISFGSMLDLVASQQDQSALAERGVRLSEIKALVADLRNSYDEWHGQVPDSRIAALNERIFNAAPELNLSHPRA